VKLACICCTYLRAHLLGHLIRSFLEQDYPRGLAELIILDDAGEYRSQKGDGWTLISIPRRFSHLGLKRNAATALAQVDAEAFCVWDDDDLYLPHALKTTAAALEKAPLSRPSQVLYEDGHRRFRRHETGGLYHGGWAYRREAFHKVGGYGPHDNGEDQEFLARLIAAGIETVDPLADGADPFYVYRACASSYHLSSEGQFGYRDLGSRRPDGLINAVNVHWPYDLGAAEILPEVHPRPF